MRSKRTPYLTLLATAALILASAVVVAYLWGDRRFVDVPLHSTDEALGAFAAIAMAAILLVEEKAEDQNKFLLLALGFLGMGVFDGFHSVSRVEQGFVFLHSAASLVGGLFFALIWLPRSAIHKIASARRWLPLALIAISLFSLTAISILGDPVPMVHAGRFTPAAVATNVLAGLFFMAAAVRLAMDVSRSESLESYPLAAVALLFGMAELTFTYSFVWSALWWFWHLLRLGAYMIVLGFIFRDLQRNLADQKAAFARSEQAEGELRQAHAQLEARVAARTAELAEANQRLKRESDGREQAQAEIRFKSILLDNAQDSVFVHDPNGRMIYVNEAAYKDRGYTHDELMALPLTKIITAAYGQKIKDRLKYVEKAGSAIFESAHVRKDGTVFAVEAHSRFMELEGRPVFVTVIRDVSERKKAKALSDALNDINAVINSTLDISQVVERVIGEATMALGCEGAAVILKEDDGWAYTYTHGLPEIEHGYKITDEEAKCAMTVAATKNLFISNDAFQDGRVDVELMRRCRFRSFISVPLISKETVVGVVDFYYRSAPVTFSESQIDFAGKLAAALSLALENARLYAEEHNIAVTLQEALLKMPKKIAGLEFGYLYNSATEEAAKVGGDFYDLFELEDGRVAMLVGDVSGKGLEAATMTSLVKNTIRAYAYQEASTAKVLSGTNEVLWKASPEGVFITVFLAVLDRRTGSLVYCCAGHPPPIVKKSAGGTYLLASTCPALGVLREFDYADAEDKLDQGDLLIFYTDGIIEARREREFFGQERLVAFVDSLKPAMAAGQVPKIILDEVASFTGGGFRDDIAVLVVSLAP